MPTTIQCIRGLIEENLSADYATRCAKIINSRSTTDIVKVFIRKKGCDNPVNVVRIKNKSCRDIHDKVVVIEDVTEIGQEAFKKCRELRKIELPSSLKIIQKEAFMGCDMLQEIVIPNDSQITEIGDRAFSGCRSLSKIRIPEKVRIIGYEAFKDCERLENVTIPENTEKLGDSSFKGCSGLQSVSILSNISEIGWHAFEKCSNLHRVEMNEGIRKIGDCAFKGCSQLSSITIPESVQEIGTSAFRNSGLNMNVLSFPASVRKISAFAFAGCGNLTKNRPVFRGEMPLLEYHSFDNWENVPRNENLENGDGHIDGLRTNELVSTQFENNAQNLILERNIINIIVQEFANRFENWLTTQYRWPLDSNTYEVDTVRTFGGYSDTLMNNLERNIDSFDIIKTIVKDWGKVNSVNDNLLHEYSQHISNVFSHRNDRNDNTSLAFVLGDNGGHIASWSKVLAAYKPSLHPNTMPRNAPPGYGDYNIYDSRVAISLSHICLSMDLPCFWIIPEPQDKQGIARLEHLVKNNQERFGIEYRSPEECYALYLDLLKGFARNARIIEVFNSEVLAAVREAYFNYTGEQTDHGFTLEQAIMAHMEKMLFIQKENILPSYNVYSL